LQGSLAFGFCLFSLSGDVSATLKATRI
jgi:hypothetical protein